MKREPKKSGGMHLVRGLHLRNSVVISVLGADYATPRAQKPVKVKTRPPANPSSLYAGAKARKEAALAAKAELDFRVKAGMYLPREAVKAALATAYQTVAQTLRSIPDNLERKLGVSPEIAEAVGLAIDESMGELAYALERIHTENDGFFTKD